MRLIGDNYFERYSKETDEVVREKKEKETEEKIKLLPKDEIPEHIDPGEEPEDTPSVNGKEENTEEVSTIADSIP
jgi:hypothetical protein